MAVDNRQAGVGNGRAAIVVLGDFGRSPRMQLHALSLASQAGVEVDVVAYRGSQPHRMLLEHPRIAMELLSPPWTVNLPRPLYLIVLPVKVLLQFASLMWVLCIKISRPDYFLVQNPPTIPTFIVVLMVCWIRRSVMVIDWHNFGYTLLGLSLGSGHPFVRIYRWCERFFGRCAYAHLCVTRAMQHELRSNWDIQATVLYDRSPEYFRPATLYEKHQLFLKLGKAIMKAKGADDWCTDAHHIEGQVLTGEGQGLVQAFATESTVITTRIMAGEGRGLWTTRERITLNEGRPAILVSSTSWTVDEDFGMLLEAALMYDRRVSAIMNEMHLGGDDSDVESMSSGRCSPLTLRRPYPNIVFIITGKGPMRRAYEEKIQNLRFQHVAFRTMWLAAEDYPVLLGSADLGICLHMSSSGLDLPMKVVDMFGCGLPVCAFGYSCIDELVKEGDNGLLFSTSAELAGQLMSLLKGFPNTCTQLHALRTGAEHSGATSKWNEEWDAKVLPLLSQLGNTWDS